MTNYVFIESRDPFGARDSQFVEQTATALKQRGHEVTIFLVQNGVLASRRTIPDSSLSRMAQAGVSLLVDDFSLCERGIHPAELHPSVQSSSIETLVSAMVRENTKVFWH
jgi:sulfur relay (sulfurtransferase) complex TusBCD TusD component (DsrE family)